MFKNMELVEWGMGCLWHKILSRLKDDALLDDNDVGKCWIYVDESNITYSKIVQTKQLHFVKKKKYTLTPI